MRVDEGLQVTAESSCSDWLIFRSRSQATGGLPKKEISGFGV
jgi:hypothetical protein